MKARNDEKMAPETGGVLFDRPLEWFHHKSLPKWGYEKEQTDTFALLHPKCEEPGKAYPLYVVFHSAGHDVYSAVGCTWLPGNHDIYHTPDDMFGLYLDCRQHTGDWWWGGNSAVDIIDAKREGVEKQPVENRVIATIEWVIEQYSIDTERVYAVGNSMGGSGALGIAMCRGDLFAAVKVNVPAGVRHMAARCCLDRELPEGFAIPDPPVLVDYSAQDDVWSTGHQVLYRGMKDKKYALMGYFGEFGHCNNDSEIHKVNDLVHSFDIFDIRLSDPYPVFTYAQTDDQIPWADDGTIVHHDAGQVNAFFRWSDFKESETSLSLSLRLLAQDEWASRVTFPESSKTDISFRRLKTCKFVSGDKVAWEFGEESGTSVADENGLVTIHGITVEKAQKVLKVYKIEKNKKIGVK